MTQEQEHEILFNEYYDLKRMNYKIPTHVFDVYLIMADEVYDILEKLGLIDKYEKWEANKGKLK